MKKALCFVLVAVFAMSAVGTFVVTETEAAYVPLCTATCDMDTYLWYYCCPYKKNPNSKKWFWDCWYGDQCYFPEQ